MRTLVPSHGPGKRASALEQSGRITHQRATHPAGGADGLGLEFGHQGAAVVLGNGGDDVHQAGLGFQAVLG